MTNFDEEDFENTTQSCLAAHLHTLADSISKVLNQVSQNSRG